MESAWVDGAGHQVHISQQETFFLASSPSWPALQFATMEADLSVRSSGPLGSDVTGRLVLDPAPQWPPQCMWLHLRLNATANAT